MGEVPAPVEVLVVCTANICRSPAAAALLKRSVGGDGIRVSSAGLEARVGSPMDNMMARLIGGATEQFAARQVTPAMIQDADLVLVMTRDQRSAVVGRVPAAVRRTFTLREFADLAVLVQQSDDRPEGTSPADRLLALAAAAPRLRGSRGAGAVDDIEDPYGRGEQANATAAAEIARAVGDLAGTLRTDVPAGRR